jgi:hypothetical protein
VVEYSSEFRARAGDELNLLPERSAIAEMLADYSVMLDQGQACRQISTDLIRKAIVPMIAIPAR